MTLLLENIDYTREIAENSWDILHEDVVRLLLVGKVKANGNLIVRGEEKIYAQIRKKIGQLVPDTRNVDEIDQYNEIPLFRCSELGIIGQRLNGSIPTIPKVRHRWTGRTLNFGHKKHGTTTYPEVTSYIECGEPASDVHEQVEIVFDSDAPAGRWENLKFEEIQEKIRQQNTKLLEDIISQF